MNRWLYIKYQPIIDRIIELGPNKHFTSGSIDNIGSRGHALSDLEARGTITCTGRKIDKTHAKVFIVNTQQYNAMKITKECVHVRNSRIDRRNH